MRKEIVPFLIIIIIGTLVYSVWFFQTQIIDAQKQTLSLQNQLASFENSSDTLQTRVSNLEAQLRDLQNPAYNVTIATVSSTPWSPMVGLAVDKLIFITVKNMELETLEDLLLSSKQYQITTLRTVAKFL